MSVKPIEILQQIKTIAAAEGMDADKIDAFAKKCYEAVPAWQPYNGAKSFAEMDSQRALNEYSYSVQSNTDVLGGLIGNISSSADMSADQKAEAIKGVADEYKTRVNAIPMPTTSEYKTIWDKVKDILSGDKRTFSAEQRRDLAKKGHAMPDGSFPISNRQDLMNALHDIGRAKNPGAAKAHIRRRAAALGLSKLVANIKELDSGLPEVGGFKVYQDLEGDLRWLSLSSNAFEDRERELFTTKALEEAVEYADRSGERGPLRIFHVPGADIGQCDYQAVVGRFLLESGTFDDTPLGAKAIEYFSSTEEDHQVSIGYKYVEGDEVDGQYDWLRITERSVCPEGTAANPWTDFQLVGDKAMDQRKVDTLEKIFGKELAGDIIVNAETKTKELEGTTRFKELDEQEEDFGEITDEVITEEKSVSSPEKHVHGNKTHTHLVTEGKSHTHDGGVSYKAMKKPPMDKEDMTDQGKDEDQEDANGNKKPMAKKEFDATELGQLIVSIMTKMDELSNVATTVGEIQAEVKALKASDDEKMANLIAPRWSFPGGIRPTDDDKNVIDNKTKELFAITDPDDKSAENPALKYVRDLLGAKD